VYQGVAVILGRISQRVARPALLVLAKQDDAEAVQELFVRRGFTVVITPSIVTLERYLIRGALPSAAVIDFSHQDAREVLSTLAIRAPRPVLVGIVPELEIPTVQDSLDAVFARPVDRARMFVRVLELIADRKRRRRTKKLTGIVGLVDGNELFHLVAHELHAAVPPVNAGAILEKALRDLGSDPFAVGEAELAALLTSGRLARALSPFAPAPAIEAALSRIAVLFLARLP
jgi:hypothetical protein